MVRRPLPSFVSGTRITAAWLLLTVAVAIAYFLAARLALALLTKPDGVAVFWPAAGVAAGLLIALGPRARWPVVIGAMAATISANLLGDRSVWSALIFAVCNAGEALIIAALIDASHPVADAELRDVQSAAARLGVQLVVLHANSDHDFEAAFARLIEQKAQALLVCASPLFNNTRDQLVALAARHNIPAAFEWREFASAGTSGT